MAFKKSKPTFLERAARGGTPSGRTPTSPKKSTMTARTPKSRNVATYVVKNGKPVKTGKMKGAMNSYRTGKAVVYNTKTPSKKMYMGKKQVLKSASRQPQSTRMAQEPIG